jgi:hypothetical protein
LHVSERAEELQVVIVVGVCFPAPAQVPQKNMSRESGQAGGRASGHTGGMAAAGPWTRRCLLRGNGESHSTRPAGNGGGPAGVWSVAVPKSLDSTLCTPTAGLGVSDWRCAVLAFVQRGGLVELYKMKNGGRVGKDIGPHCSPMDLVERRYEDVQRPA